MATEGEWSVEKMSFVACDKIFYDARILDQNGDIAGHIGDASDARRIVTAVNCHEELVGLVDMVRCAMEANDNDLFISTTVDWLEILARIDAVLAKAKGES